MRRGELTGILLTAARSADIPVGDGEPPKEGGWPQGTPNVGSHVPFSVLEAGSAQGISRTVTAQASKDFSANYTLSTYAVRRDTCDELAYRVREALRGITPMEFSGFKAVHVSFSSIGAVRKQGQVQPDLWWMTDIFDVYCVPLR